MAALELFVNANTWKQQLEIAKLSYFQKTLHASKEAYVLLMMMINFDVSKTAA